MEGDAACHQARLDENTLADGMAFAVIGVEHVIWSTAENRVDLPRQIGGVLYPGVHALPTHRRMDMRRVSDDKTVRMARNGEIFFNCYGPIRLNVHAEGPR